MPAYTIDTDKLDAYQQAEGITSRAELARRMSVDPATVSRVLSQKHGPSGRFIAGLRTAFPGRDVMSLLTATTPQK